MIREFSKTHSEFSKTLWEVFTADLWLQQTEAATGGVKKVSLKIP